MSSSRGGAGTLIAPMHTEDDWFVTNGVRALGPVTFDRLARGVALGRIPADSFVRHHSWKVWRGLREIGELSAPDRHATVVRLRGLCEGAETRAADPSSLPPPPLSQSASLDGSRESGPPLSAVRAATVDPVGVLASARTLPDALLLSVSTAVAAANADVGVLYLNRRDLGAMIATYAHGPGTEALLGARLPVSDPALVTALSGCTLMAEPSLGEAGRHVAGRLGDPERVAGVAMVPVVVFDWLLAMLEIGRRAAPFRAREIARVEDVVEALVARVVVEGWAWGRGAGVDSRA